MTRASQLILVGDEAYTPEEWGAIQRRRDRRREWERTYRARPEVRERLRLYQRAWRARNRDRLNAYNRERMWARRHAA